MNYLDKLHQLKAQKARESNSKTLNQNKYAFLRDEVKAFQESMSRNIPNKHFSTLFGSDGYEEWEDTINSAVFDASADLEGFKILVDEFISYQRSELKRLVDTP